MLFHVRDLELRAARFDVDLAPGSLEFFDSKLRQTGDLHASGKVELVAGSLGEIRASGHVRVEVEAECDRCLEPARYTVDSGFDLHYRPAADGYGEQAAIDDAESEMGFYEGEGLEMHDFLREHVLLALPMQCLCSEDCKGICPVCGQNRNQQACACGSAMVDDRWAALRHLQ